MIYCNENRFQTEQKKLWDESGTFERTLRWFIQIKEINPVHKRNWKTYFLGFLKKYANVLLALVNSQKGEMNPRHTNLLWMWCAIQYKCHQLKHMGFIFILLWLHFLFIASWCTLWNIHRITLAETKRWIWDHNDVQYTWFWTMNSSNGMKNK